MPIKSVTGVRQGKTDEFRGTKSIVFAECLRLPSNIQEMCMGTGLTGWGADFGANFK
jgi:hypothetical protein